MMDHPFLSIFEPSAAARLLDHSRILEFEDGSVIFREGDPADALYVVLQGQVSLTTSAAGRQEYLAVASEDDFLANSVCWTGSPAARRLPQSGACGC